MKNISLIYCQKKYKYEPNLIEYMGNEELNKTNSFYNSMKKIDEEKNKKNKNYVYIPNESAYFSESIFIKAKEKIILIKVLMIIQKFQKKRKI